MPLMSPPQPGAQTLMRRRAPSPAFGQRLFLLLSLNWKTMGTARSPQAFAGDPPCSRGRGGTPRDRGAGAAAAASSRPQ
ncbi:hypothetical protein NDU88_002104 [Pleurodeles waltl]|uniref:Uncharacterized protein n=1 Tax=Pleurodeles waltl TaxID=8319 RepID=A0AAV7REJ2_PLEWA|nr:hypothetical protein NDU88_002104 [Pleurodeles waltl]